MGESRIPEEMQRGGWPGDTGIISEVYEANGVCSNIKVLKAARSMASCGFIFVHIKICVASTNWNQALLGIEKSILS